MKLLTILLLAVMVAGCNLPLICYGNSQPVKVAQREYYRNGIGRVFQTDWKCSEAQP